MSSNSPKEGGQPGTTDQWPRWEGPEETRPRGYLPAQDDPQEARDADGAHQGRENLIRKRAFELWEARGRQEGTHEEDWAAAAQEIDAELSKQAISPFPETSGIVTPENDALENPSRAADRTPDRKIGKRPLAKAGSR